MKLRVMSKEDKLKIKRFKDGSSSWWVGIMHYCLNEKNEICFVGGGIDTENHRKILEVYIKRTKSVFIPREASLFDQEEKEYITLSFGKHKGFKLNEVKEIEPKYLRWLYENSAEKDIKEQIKELLKIK